MPRQRRTNIKATNARSRVTNGKRMFLRVPGDNRSETARRTRDIFNALCSDLGGFEFMSEAEKQLARRAAFISIKCEEMEADAVISGNTINLDLFGQMTDRLGRCLQRLGIKRVPRDVKLTPSVKDYIEHVNANDP
jgi:hypothetical protein